MCSFLLCVAINHELLCNCAITLLGVVGKKNKPGKTLLGRNGGIPPQKPLKFVGILKLRCMPEIKGSDRGRVNIEF